jgi:hypothetical protein
MEGTIFPNLDKTKQKTKTKIYKMKNVFDDGKKSTLPNKEKNKIIAKVKKPVL